jgi:hypothetical protein
MSRQEMIDDLMEGIAFEDDYTIASAFNRYRQMSDEEIAEEYAQVNTK